MAAGDDCIGCCRQPSAALASPIALADPDATGCAKPVAAGQKRLIEIACGGCMLLCFGVEAWGAPSACAAQGE